MTYFRPVTTIPPDTTPNISEPAYRSGYSQALEDYAVADILKAVVG